VSRAITLSHITGVIPNLPIRCLFLYGTGPASPTQPTREAGTAADGVPPDRRGICT